MRHSAIGILAALALPLGACGVGQEDPEGWAAATSTSLQADGTLLMLQPRIEFGSALFGLVNPNQPSGGDDGTTDGGTPISSTLETGVAGAGASGETALPQDPIPWRDQANPEAPLDEDSPDIQGPGVK